ncbi:MAG: Gfo/Idh/MocA family oxidoreductase [Clostridia bacterium]|nr:Gfo/Idh/MocA family oxidoreductase [Clostridia bacterium]
MSNKVRLGILGLGNMGSEHCQNLKAGKCPEIELTAVCDVKPARLDWAKETLGEGVARFTDAEAMMDSGKIDAILVAVPHYDHPKYSIMAMKKGLHVMCEKPAGVYTKQVLEMNKVADECGVTFAIMMNLRTGVPYQKLKEIIESGELGNIRRVNWIVTTWYRPQAYYDSGDWRATWSGEGGGVLLNQCPHNLDMLQWICGMPSKVTAHLHFGKWHDIEVEDDVTAYLEYPNGATGVFITSTADAPGSNRFEITFDKGRAIVELPKEGGKFLTVWKSANGMTEQEFSATNTSPFGSPKFVKEEIDVNASSTSHPGVLNAFAANILRGEPLLADGREGINGLTLSNAMHLSAWTGKTVDVENFDHDLYYEELMRRVATSRRKTNVVETAPVDMSNTYGV